MKVDIEDDMLRVLRQLCHPDRHGSSEASNRATRWLNDLAKNMRTAPPPAPPPAPNPFSFEEIMKEHMESMRRAQQGYAWQEAKKQMQENIWRQEQARQSAQKSTADMRSKDEYRKMMRAFGILSEEDIERNIANMGEDFWS